MTVLMAIVFFGIVIFVHELGHFISAKLGGVRVLKFSLGFGPRVAGLRYRDTEYLISLVPLGGYVKMLGEEPETELSEDDKRFSFSHKPVTTRALIVFSGPLFNLLFACIVFFIVYLQGIPVLTPSIGEVMENSPAHEAGIKKGDIVLTAGGVYGKVVGVAEKAVTIDIGDGVKMRVNKNYIQAVTGPDFEPGE